eukprot:2305135-Pyramimonas_sp.AAC.1
MGELHFRVIRWLDKVLTVSSGPYLQAVLDHQPPSKGPIAMCLDCIVAIVEQFHADRPRHGSTYTNFIARFEQHKAAVSVTLA